METTLYIKLQLIHRPKYWPALCPSVLMSISRMREVIPPLTLPHIQRRELLSPKVSRQRIALERSVVQRSSISVTSSTTVRIAGNSGVDSAQSVTGSTKTRTVLKRRDQSAGVSMSNLPSKRQRLSYPKPLTPTTIKISTRF